MAKFLLLSLHPLELKPADLEPTPELIEQVDRTYREWAHRMRSSGVLLQMSKLRDEGGTVVQGWGDDQFVTEGPYAESKELLAGYWVVEAEDYQAAVALVRDCPTLQYWGKLLIREIEIYEPEEN